VLRSLLDLRHWVALFWDGILVARGCCTTWHAVLAGCVLYKIAGELYLSDEKFCIVTPSNAIYVAFSESSGMIQSR
jgi:hypothetical protein